MRQGGGAAGGGSSQSRRSSTAGAFVYESGVWKEGGAETEDEDDDGVGFNPSRSSRMGDSADPCSPANRARRATQEQSLALVAASGNAPGEAHGEFHMIQSLPVCKS